MPQFRRRRGSLKASSGQWAVMPPASRREKTSPLDNGIDYEILMEHI